jgi:hypothetical protein
MKIFLSLLFNVLIYFSFAQYAPILKGKVSCARFLKSTTCVVLSENEAYNQQLTQSMEQSWTITPYKLISYEEFNLTVSNTDYSFIYAEEFDVKGEKKEIGALALFNGGFTDTKFYLNSSLAYVAYDNWGIEKELADIVKKIPAMIYQLQETISLINEYDISGNNEDAITKQLNKIYNERAGVLKSKTLLIDKRYQNIKIISTDELSKIYKYTFEFVSSDAIQEAIMKKDPTKAVLFSSYNLHKINTVIDCGTYETIFCEKEIRDLVFDQSLNLFDSGDMEELNSFVKRSKVD